MNLNIVTESYLSRTLITGRGFSLFRLSIFSLLDFGLMGLGLMGRRLRRLTLLREIGHLAKHFECGGDQVNVTLLAPRHSAHEPFDGLTILSVGISVERK